MKAVERGEVDKVAAVLSKKGIIPTKLDVEGRSAWVNTHTHAHIHVQYVDIRSQRDMHFYNTLSTNIEISHLLYIELNVQNVH